MSDPYGGGYQPYEPRPNPYDSSEGPSPGPHYPAVQPVAPTDGLSIAALVCSLTCCGAPVGIGLGIAGLVRTQGGRRGGRWAAVTGIAVGAVVLVCAIGFFAFAAVMGSRTVWEDEARVGQCVDLDTFISDEVDLIKARCGEPHDAEVIWVDRFDAALLQEWRETSSADFCAARPIEEEYAALIERGDHSVGVTTNASDSEDPDGGDWFVCYLEPEDGQLRGALR